VTGIQVWTGASFQSATPPDARMERFVNRMLDAMTSPEPVAVLKDALAIVTANLDPQSTDFGRNALLFMDRLAELKEKLQAAESAIAAPPTVLLEGQKTFVHDQSMLERGAEYSSQIEAFARDVKDTSFSHVGLVRDWKSLGPEFAGLDPAKAEDRERLDAAYRQAHEAARRMETLIFAPDVKSLADVQTRFETTVGRQFILLSHETDALTTEGVSKEEGRVALSMRLHVKAQSSRDMVRVAGHKIASPYRKLVAIPGLVEMPDGSFVWLPMIKAFELMRILKEANEMTRAVGAAA